MEINDIIQSKRRMVQERIEKAFGVDIEKARMAGDTKVKNGKTFVWTEYAPGKFDWRISNKKTPVNPRVVNNKNKKEQSTEAVKVPKGIKLVDEDSWVEIYDKNGKKIKEEYFADLGFDPDEKWNEKDGNYDIKGGGKMVVTKKSNSREEAKKEDKKEKNESVKNKFYNEYCFEPGWGNFMERNSQYFKDILNKNGVNSYKELLNKFDGEEQAVIDKKCYDRIPSNVLVTDKYVKDKVSVEEDKKLINN